MICSDFPTLSHGNSYVFYEVANSYEFVLDELQLSKGLLWKAGEETITIIHLLVIKA